MTTTALPKPRSAPWWLVVGIFVVVPVTLSFIISRQAAAQQIRRKAIASSHGWAIENKNEGQRAWILHGFHRDVEFEAVHLLREGGGTAWRLRMPLGREVPSWVLVAKPGDWRAIDFGTISTLVTRSELPPVATGGPAAFTTYGAPAVVTEMLRPQVMSALSSTTLPGVFALSFVDDAVMIDGAGDLPEGEALVPWLDFSASLVRVFSPDAG